MMLSLLRHRRPLHAVRGLLGAALFGAALAAAVPALAQPAGQAPAPREGVEVGQVSKAASLVPAGEVEQQAGQQYQQMLQQAASKRALAPAGHPQLERLRTIARKLLPHAVPWNDRARNWRWEVNLIGSNQINAFCMPGGKIAFYTGILDQLKLTDDEVAMVMGHEIAHALREHARERMGKGMVTQGVARLGGALIAGVFGVDPRVTDFAAQGAANLVSLKFSRDDETEADLVGMEIAARAGYDPRASVTLWRKMSQNAKNAPPQWMSTHPAGETRIHELERNLPKVQPLYERAVAAGPQPATAPVQR